MDKIITGNCKKLNLNLFLTRCLCIGIDIWYDMFFSIELYLSIWAVVDRYFTKFLFIVEVKCERSLQECSYNFFFSLLFVFVSVYYCWCFYIIFWYAPSCRLVSFLNYHTLHVGSSYSHTRKVFNCIEIFFSLGIRVLWWNIYHITRVYICHVLSISPLWYKWVCVVQDCGPFFLYEK